MKSDQKNSLKLAIIAVLIASIVGGGNSVFVKIALSEIPVFSLNFLRFLLSFLLILPLFIREKPKINKGILKVVLFSLLPLINTILFAFGVQLTTATIAQTLYSTVPIIAGILSFLILKEKIGGGKIIGIGAGFIGALFLVFLPVIGTPSVFNGDLKGNLLIVLAILSFSFYTVLSKPLQKKYSPIFLTTCFMLVSAIVSFFLSLSDFDKAWWTNVSWIGVSSLLYLSIFGTVAHYIFYQYAIKHGTPLIASTILYLQPIIAFIIAFVLLGERITGGFIIGAIIILLGTWRVTKSSKSSAEINPTK